MTTIAYGQVQHDFGGSWLVDKVDWIGGVRAERAPAERSARIIARRLVREQALRELLGRWVSELEPVQVLDTNGRLCGLTYAGQPVGGRVTIVIGIKGGVAI